MKKLPVKLAIKSVLLGSFLALIVSGCAYHLGPTNGAVAGAKTVEIIPFKNQTLQPQVNDSVTQQVRKGIQHDGTYRLASHPDTGDIVVEGTVTKYVRQGMTYQPKDVVTVRDFRILMTVHVVSHERATGKLLFDEIVTGTTLVRAGNDLPSDERQALPTLADDVAKKVISLVVDGTW
jgi:hypothetical protein